MPRLSSITQRDAKIGGYEYDGHICGTPGHDIFTIDGAVMICDRDWGAKKHFGALAKCSPFWQSIHPPQNLSRVQMMMTPCRFVQDRFDRLPNESLVHWHVLHLKYINREDRYSLFPRKDMKIERKWPTDRMAGSGKFIDINHSFFLLGGNR